MCTSLERTNKQTNKGRTIYRTPSATRPMRRSTRDCKAVLVLTFMPLAAFAFSKPTRAKPLHVAIRRKVNRSKANTVRCGAQMIETGRIRSIAKPVIRSCKFDACRWDRIGIVGVFADSRLILMRVSNERDMSLKVSRTRGRYISQ